MIFILIITRSRRCCTWWSNQRNCSGRRGYYSWLRGLWFLLLSIFWFFKDNIRSKWNLQISSKIFQRCFVEDIWDGRSPTVIPAKTHVYQFSHVLWIGIWNGIILPSNDFQNQSTLIICFEWMLISAHFIQNTTKSPDVALLIIRFFLTHFGWKIKGGSYHSIGKINLVLQNLGHSQITQSDVLVLSQENIHWFYISMQNLSFVQIIHSEADLNEELPYLIFRQRPSELCL